MGVTPSELLNYAPAFSLIDINKLKMLLHAQHSNFRISEIQYAIKQKKKTKEEDDEDSLSQSNILEILQHVKVLTANIFYG